MVKNLSGDSLKEVSGDKGIAGAGPGSVLPYLAIGNIFFDSMGELHNALSTADQQLKDIPNFTNKEPVLKISEVIV